MRGSLYIQNNKIGEVDFRIVDPVLGNIGGTLFTSEQYAQYKKEIQQLTVDKGLADSTDFPFSVVFINDIKHENFENITVTDFPELDEIYVECEAVGTEILERMRE